MPRKPRQYRSSQQARPAVERRRPSACSLGYDRRWRKARKAYLAEHPLCAECARQGRDELASVVDHVQPHRGDSSLFWDQSNWQPLCRSCHSRKTAKHDGGFGNA